MKYLYIKWSVKWNYKTISQTEKNFIKYFPRRRMTCQVTISRGNSPQVKFLKRQQFSKTFWDPIDWNRGQAIRALWLGKTWEVAAYKMAQNWEVATWENTLGKFSLGKIPLGSCHLGKYPWEVATWENTLGKLPLVKKPLRNYLTWCFIGNDPSWRYESLYSVHQGTIPKTWNKIKERWQQGAPKRWNPEKERCQWCSNCN